MPSGSRSNQWQRTGNLFLERRMSQVRWSEAGWGRYNVRAGESPSVGVLFFSQISRISWSATTLLPGQDNSAPSSPMLGAHCFVVSCGVRLSEVGVAEIRNPQVGGVVPLAPSRSSSFLSLVRRRAWYCGIWLISDSAAIDVMPHG
jgi:hypothetical protein